MLVQNASKLQTWGLHDRCESGAVGAVGVHHGGRLRGAGALWVSMGQEIARFSNIGRAAALLSAHPHLRRDRLRAAFSCDGRTRATAPAAAAARASSLVAAASSGSSGLD